MGNVCCMSRVKEDRYTSIVEKYRGTGEKYTDDEFPNDPTSLISDWNDQSPDIMAIKDDWKQIQWIRAEEIKILNDEKEGLKVFQGSIEPNDIKQGALGDCYFLSSLSVIAERPNRISNLFVTKEVNSESIYAVNITKNGEPQQIIVDSYLPCLNGQPIFSSAHGDELWVLIMEKAWAKAHGSYERIVGGQAHQTLRDLLGAPGYEHETSDEGIWAEIVEADKNDYIMAAGVSQNSEEDAKTLQKIGLVGGHSYGLIAVHVVKDKKGQNSNIIQLRNPWGSFEWNGDWGDKSDCWTDEAKAEVNFTDADDGAFWMSFDDFKKYFSRIQICKFQNEFSFTSFKCKHTQIGYHLVKMQVNQAGHHTVSVSQKDERCFPRNSGYEYNNCRFIMMKLTDAQGISSGVTFIKGTKGYQDRDTYIEVDDLEKGTYYLFVEMEWNDATPSAERCFNVTDYGPGKTSFFADEAGAYSLEKVLCEVYLSKASQRPEDVEVKPMVSKKAPLITRYECNQAPEGYNFVLVENEDPEARYRESVDYTTFEGLKILGSDEHKYDLDVGPSETKIILMRAEIQGFNMAASMTSTVHHGDNKLKQMCIDNDKKTQRGGVEIYCYQLQHEGGMFYIFVNNTQNKKLREEIEYTLEGLEIVGQESQTNVLVEVGPGQEQIVKLGAIGGSWKISQKMKHEVSDWTKGEEQK